MKKIFVIAFIFPIVAYSQDYLTDSLFIKTISNNILASKSADSNLYYLTKKIGGRLAGSPKTAMAENWGVTVLKQAGADNIMLQECMVPHWVRGAKEKAVVYYQDGKEQNMVLNVLALGNSTGTGANGIKAPLIRVNTFDELEQRKEEVKNKIVFYNCPFDDTLINTFYAYGKNVVYRAIGPSRAAKYGALAVLVRSMTNGTDNNPHTGSLFYIDTLPKIPAAAVGLRDVEKLDALFDKNITITAELFTYAQMLPDAIAHNVIGELKGTEFPDEIITVGGHLDSWDVAEGAHDDGAGIIQTIEVLRAFNALGFHPKHTIHFVLFANEENGTRGAKKYADEAKEKNEMHIFALESDAGGFTPRGFSFDVPQQAWEKMNSWRSLLAPYYGDRFTTGGGGADIEPLKDAFQTPLAELIPDSQRYFDIHHAVTDIFENVNMRELKLGAINMAALLYLIDKYGL
ncbi:MAG: M20/M25/M40 family metallo-hydrolase [Parafilimonas sp.]